MRKSPPALTVLFSMLLMLSGPALAQDAPAAGDKSNMRFIQQFSQDAAIVDKQWYGIELRFQSGAVPPIEKADGFLLTPTIAVSPFRNLEVGGTVSYIDYSLDNERPRPGETRTFDGETGLGDLTAWGKYQFYNRDNVSFSAGLQIILPTGSEDDGLGTGKVVPAFFAAVRVKAGDGYFLGDAGVRLNRDATILNSDASGRNSTFIGGGYIWEAYENWIVSAEINVESERFDDSDSPFPVGSSDFRATGGIQYSGIAHSFLRGGIGIGLSDGAPDYELILGYAYHF